MIIINIAEDFSKTPGGRYTSEGPFSGEEFREKYLKPKFLQAKEANTKLRINLDGCYGYPSSFLDESFGGLARELNDTKLLDYLEFVSNDQPGLIDYIMQCINNSN